MKKELAPIAVFTYKRLDTLKQTIDALKECKLASQSVLYIYSDSFKNEKDKEQVLNVREYLHTINGFKEIKIIHSDFNKGLAKSVISGVEDVILRYGKVIVVEDDLIASGNFLVYMNKALDYYENNKTVFSISGYTIPIVIKNTYESDVYFLPRVSSWGWATWTDRWQKVDWEVNDFEKFASKKTNIKKFNEGGSDLYNMLKKQIDGVIDSWAIRWCYSQYINKSLTVYPCISKIKNIGFGKNATHSNVYNRYKTKLDEGLNEKFNFSDNINIDENMLLQFQSFFSFKTRFVGRIKTYLFKTGVLKNV